MDPPDNLAGGLNILVPAVPARLTITEMMIEDFVWNPVLAFRYFYGIELDAFQRVRLKLMWFVPELIDSSGFSSGKTLVNWGYVNLRCLLMTGHDAGVYYPTFETMKGTFFTYYNHPAIGTPIFRAHLGLLDDKGEEAGAAGGRPFKGASCFKAFFRNGSKVLMPAPGFLNDASSQASLRFNTLLVEEWTHIDAMGEGVNKQLIGRVTKESPNQHHPVWANHITFTAPAKSMMHPSYERYAGNLAEARSGNPHFACITFSHKDYSDRPSNDGRSYRERWRIDSTISSLKLKHKNDRAGWLGEGLGIWARSGKGWFTEEAILNCIELGRRRGVTPITRAD
jgi:hypothetical protein